MHLHSVYWHHPVPSEVPFLSGLNCFWSARIRVKLNFFHASDAHSSILLCVKMTILALSWSTETSPCYSLFTYIGPLLGWWLFLLILPRGPYGCLHYANITMNGAFRTNSTPTSKTIIRYLLFTVIFTIINYFLNRRDDCGIVHHWRVLCLLFSQGRWNQIATGSAIVWCRYFGRQFNHCVS